MRREAQAACPSGPRARRPRVSDSWILPPGWRVFSPRGPSVSWVDPEPRGPGTLAGPGGQPGCLVISCAPERSRGRSLRDLLAGFCPGSQLPLTPPPATTLLGRRPASHLLESFLFQARGYLVAQPPGRKEGMIPKSTLSAPAARLGWLPQGKGDPSVQSTGPQLVRKEPEGCRESGSWLGSFPGLGQPTLPALALN